MRLGISLTSAHTVEDSREGARWMIERAAAAREAGLDSLFVGDHHSMPVPYYQNVPMMGRLLAEWGDAPAGCLFLLPLWNPVLLAEQVGTLASMHRGRFIIQCALGADERQFAGMGADIRTRPSAFEEALDIIRRLFGGEVVTSEGRFKVRGARISPRPPEPVSFWIGAEAEKAIDRAARLGEGWLASPGLTPGQAASQLSLYVERCQAYGREPEAVAIRRDVYVSANEDEAERMRGASKGYRGFDPSALTCGTIEQVTASFRELGELGYTDVIVRHLTDDQELVLGSMARLGEVRAGIA